MIFDSANRSKALPPSAGGPKLQPQAPRQQEWARTPTIRHACTPARRWLPTCVPLREKKAGVSEKKTGVFDFF